jgi:hypothetical protein
MSRLPWFVSSQLAAVTVALALFGCASRKLPPADPARRSATTATSST